MRGRQAHPHVCRFVSNRLPGKGKGLLAGASAQSRRNVCIEYSNPRASRPNLALVYPWTI